MTKYSTIILCGGMGTRVSKHTKKIPKCLININGKPFLYYQLKYLKKNKINNVLLSAGYMAGKIKKYIKNIKFIDVKINADGKKLLGTGGAILKSLHLLKPNFYVIYGDSYLNFKLTKLRDNKNFPTMAIYKNNNKFDKSNVKLGSGRKIIYFKNKKKKLQYIDYGAAYLNKKIFKNKMKYSKFDLADLYEKISKRNMLNGYKVSKRFYEIGSYNGINDLKKYLNNK